jgi:SAM-dependent methyltransferase
MSDVRVIRRFRRLRPKDRSAWLSALVTAGIVANGLRTRRRLSAMAVLPASDRAPDPDHVFLCGDGVVLDDATVRAASAYAVAHDLDVLDLVPADLSTERALELARTVDPRTYRRSRLATGRTAGHATLVHRSVLDRAGLDLPDELDPVAHVKAIGELKRYAPTTTDLAVAPSLRAAPEDLDKRVAYLRAIYGDASGPFILGPLIEQASLAAGVVRSPGWGLAALTAYSAQPALAFSGTALRPADAAPASLPTRLLRDARRSASTLGGRWEPATAPTPDTKAFARAEYDALLSEGIDRFFEDRVEACPRCQSPDLREHVRVTDLIQFKPGEFVLDRCETCRHVFQNPRLSIEGLDFYYRDFYDGLGEEELEFIFAQGDDSYAGRVDMVRRRVEPKRWLDVGAGHGHFCLVAGEALPDTRFDGLDMTDSIDEAARRGWIDRAHRGLFPEVAADLPGAYDVVSMHHYLEHTREPWDEIDAAHTVLQEGGHLLVEVPDPESRVGARLGWAWGPWFQPQHQHFLTVDNLTRELLQRGFSVIDVERGPAHQPVDLAFGLFLLANKLGGPPDKPWLPESTLGHKIRRGAVFGLLALPMLGALVLDKALAPLVRRTPKASNTYRLLACKS